jgi:dsDNA-binding SOS-regulon protein
MTAPVDAAAFAELKTKAATGKLTVSIDLAGEPTEFTFRKPMAREWMEYEAAEVTMGVATKSGTLNTAVTKEMMEQAEQLCVRIVTSHSPQQLQDLNDEHLGIFLPLATSIAAVIEVLRAGAPKGSPKSGAASSSTAKSPGA